MELSLRPASAFFLIVLGWILLRSEKAKNKYVSLYLFTTFSEIFLNLGYLVKIGSFEVNYSYISLAITAFFGVTIQVKMSKGMRLPIKNALLFFMTVIAGLVIRILSPYEIYGIDHSIAADALFNGVSLRHLSITVYSWITLAKIMLVIYTTALLISIYDDNTFKTGFFKYIPIFRTYIIFAVVEFVCNNLIAPTFIRNLVLIIFGAQKASVKIPYYRVGLYSILLTCNEPSLVAYLLFFSCLGILWYGSEKKLSNQTKWIWIGISMMMLSLTLTGLVFSAILIFIMLQRKKRGLTKSKCVKITLVLVASIVSALAIPDIISYFNERFLKVVQYIGYLLKNSNSDSVFTTFGGRSEVVRMYSIFSCVTIFFRCPILGAGLGTQTGCSGWLSVLAQVGMLGIFFFSREINCWLKIINKKNTIAKSVLLLAFTVQGGMTDILASTYYYIWLILISSILNSSVIYDLKRLNEDA